MIVTIWYPDGLHKIAGINMTAIGACDIWTSDVTGRVYFGKPEVALTSDRAVVTFELLVKNHEVAL